MDKIYRPFTSEVKALADERALLVTITTPTPDRSMDVVVPTGGKLENFLKNPVVLFGHDYSQPPVAQAVSLTVSEAGITAKVQFPTEGSYPFADTIYSLYAQGIMRAWSVGFMAMQMEPMATGGMRFTEWELFEFSAVPVPANPEALTMMRSLGLDDDAIHTLTQAAPKLIGLNLTKDFTSITLTHEGADPVTYELDAAAAATALEVFAAAETVEEKDELTLSALVAGLATEAKRQPTVNELLSTLRDLVAPKGGD